VTRGRLSQTPRQRGSADPVVMQVRSGDIRGVPGGDLGHRRAWSRL